MGTITKWIDEHLKAIVSGVGSLVVLFFTLKNDADGITANDWQTIIVAALALGGLTYAVPNAKPTTPPPSGDTEGTS